MTGCVEQEPPKIKKLRKEEWYEIWWVWVIIVVGLPCWGLIILYILHECYLACDPHAAGRYFQRH